MTVISTRSSARWRRTIGSVSGPVGPVQGWTISDTWFGLVALNRDRAGLVESNVAVMLLVTAYACLTALSFFCHCVCCDACVVCCQYKEAEVDLELALRHCHKDAKHNKKRILNHLVPLKLRLGEDTDSCTSSYVCRFTLLVTSPKRAFFIFSMFCSCCQHVLLSFRGGTCFCEIYCAVGGMLYVGCASTRAIFMCNLPAVLCFTTA